MKSSSRFFPARLMSAEVQSGLAEDVYLIKPNNSTDKSVELAITHLSLLDKAKANTRRPALALLHGCYQNRRLWFSWQDDCLARSLVLAGFDVWLMESRGHGVSPVNQCYDSNTLVDYARYDIPAANMFIREQVGTAVSWVGYAEGAGALLLSLASQALRWDSVVSVMGMGAPFDCAFWSRVPGLHLGRSFIPGSLKRNSLKGPEPEPLSLMQQLITESRWFKRRGASIGMDVWKTLRQSGEVIHWLGSAEALSDQDNGLKTLFDAGCLLPNPCSLTAEDLASQCLDLGLTDGDEIANLIEWFTLATGADPAVYDVLPTRKASSIA